MIAAAVLTLIAAGPAIPVLEHGNAIARACPLPWGVVTAGHAAPEGKTVLVSGREMGSPLRHVALDFAMWPGEMPGIPALPRGRAPVRGLKVVISGIDQRLGSKEVEGELVGPLAGGGVQWVVSDGPGPGSSGSCVVDRETGAVVGVTTSGRSKDATNTSFISVMTPVRELTADRFRMVPPGGRP